MPEFIQEVGDFKSFVKDYQCSVSGRLIGLAKMHLFRFYKDNDGIPVMNFKRSVVDSQWLPSNKPSLPLWNRDLNEKTMLPPGYPKPVPFKPM